MSEIKKAKHKIKKYYKKQTQRKLFLEENMKGFLCSCNNREKECIRETYNILNEYADKLYGVRKKIENLSKDEDIEDSLSREINALKEEDKPVNKRFQQIESGAKNFLFVHTTLENPAELVESVMKDIFESKEAKTRFLIKLVPVEITCKANIENIVNACQKLVVKYFTDSPHTFSVLYNHRNNNNLVRDEVIKQVANEVFNSSSDHKVDLKNPELAIIIEVCKGFAFLSVIKNFVKYRKYNLLKLSEHKEGIETVA